MNLVLNAMDAAGPGGLIKVQLEQSDSKATINVRDSGPGLTDDQTEHLFEAFYTTKRDGHRACGDTDTAGADGRHR